MSLQDIFNAGRVRRWHTNPVMADTDDRIDGHSGRVARIIARLHPRPSADLLVAALTHDDGEIAIADIGGPAKEKMKRENPEAYAALEAMERDHREKLWGGVGGWCAPQDGKWLKFADKLDGYMWVKHHKPQELRNADWIDVAVWLFTEAHDLCNPSDAAMITEMLDIEEQGQ